MPLAFYSVCKPCHAALHARFDDAPRWQLVIGAHPRTEGWITALSLDPKSQWQSFDVTYPAGLGQTPINAERTSGAEDLRLENIDPS